MDKIGNGKLLAYPLYSSDSKVEDIVLHAPAILNDIKKHVNHLISLHPVNEIILGCTHYPIVQNFFEAVAPDIKFINPAHDQAISIKNHLGQLNLLNSSNIGTLQINTSGSMEIYKTVLGELSITKPHTFSIRQF